MANNKKSARKRTTKNTSMFYISGQNRILLILVALILVPVMLGNRFILNLITYQQSSQTFIIVCGWILLGLIYFSAQRGQSVTTYVMDIVSKLIPERKADEDEEDENEAADAEFEPVGAQHRRHRVAYAEPVAPPIPVTPAVQDAPVQRVRRRSTKPEFETVSVAKKGISVEMPKNFGTGMMAIVDGATLAVKTVNLPDEKLLSPDEFIAINPATGDVIILNTLDFEEDEDEALVTEVVAD